MAEIVCSLLLRRLARAIEPRYVFSFTTLLEYGFVSVIE